MNDEAEHIEEEDEVVDGLPVLADETRAIETVAPGMVPARQAAALAATGFVAGAATVALVNRRKIAKVTKRRGKKRSALGEVVGSNSFLVDVHLLRRD